MHIPVRGVSRMPMSRTGSMSDEAQVVTTVICAAHHATTPAVGVVHFTNAHTSATDGLSGALTHSPVTGTRSHLTPWRRRAVHNQPPARRQVALVQQLQNGVHVALECLGIPIVLEDVPRVAERPLRHIKNTSTVVGPPSANRTAETGRSLTMLSH